MQEIIDQLEAIKEKMRSEGKQAVGDYFAKFFQDHPEITAVKWEQYTPFFNDGETCEFGIREVYFKIDPHVLAQHGALTHKYKNEMSLSDPAHLDEDGMFSCWEMRDVLAPIHSICSPLRGDMDKASELLEITLGDHVSVTATKDGITVEEYSDHD